MKTSRILVSVAVTVFGVSLLMMGLGVVGTPRTAVDTPNQPSRLTSQPNGSDFTLWLNDPRPDSYIDNGRGTVGDRIIVHGSLESRQGGGPEKGRITSESVFWREKASTALFDGVFWIEGRGQIVASGNVEYESLGRRMGGLVVSGGSGRYQGNGGRIVVHVSNKGHVSFDFFLEPTLVD